MADDGEAESDGNEDSSEPQAPPASLKKGDGIPRSRDFDALFLLGVTALVLIFTLVIFLIKP